MKKIVTLIILASFLAALAPGGARAALPPQEEEGTVVLPGPGPNGGVIEGCWTGWARRFWIFTDGASAGPFGSMFEIDKTTWNGKFKLEVVSGQMGTEDLDITFYADPGHIDPADPAMQGGIQESGAYLSREPGGEDGIVPRTATLALVCLGTGTGFNAEWTYTATPPAKKKKK